MFLTTNKASTVMSLSARRLAVFSSNTNTLGHAYNEQKDAREITYCKWVFVVAELFNIAVNDFDANFSSDVRCNRTH